MIPKIPAVYLAAFLVGVVIEVLVPIPGPSPALGIAAAVIGIGTWLALDPPAMAHFKRAKTGVGIGTPTTALVTTGPYRFSRNPMYLGLASLYAGLALAFGVIWALALLPIVLLFLDRRVIPPEERKLEEQFGAEYRDYKARVRRWV